MLTKILEINDLVIENPEQQRALNTDLLRLRKFKHLGKPKGTEAFRVEVKNGIYFDSFRFKIQYGKLGSGGKFVPLGNPISICSEALPYLN